MEKARTFAILGWTLILIFIMTGTVGAGSSPPSGTRLATGGEHILVIRTDGTLWASGNNGEGQLGTGTFINTPVPMQVGSGTTWVAVAAGAAHSLGVKADGSLWAWGNNMDGQLGDGSHVAQGAPVRVGTGNDWVAVAAGATHSLALKRDGTLWAWGSNHLGELGNGDGQAFPPDQFVPVPVLNPGASPYVAIAAGVHHSLAVQADGSLWGWGSNEFGELGMVPDLLQHPVPTRIGTATNWIQVSGGDGHSAALRADGTIWTWGFNVHGQLGRGTPALPYLPAQIGTARDWVSVSAGALHTVAVKRNGTLWTWGSNLAGQLGDGGNVSRDLPQQVATLSEVITAAGGESHTIAVTARGDFYAWGDNKSGELGNGSLDPAPTPTLIATFPTRWTSVDAGNTHSTAAKTTGTLWFWGSSGAGQTTPTPVNMGNGAAWFVTSSGGSHAVAIKADGTLWSWGDNTIGQLGNNSAVSTATPVAIGAETNWKAVAAGGTHTLGLKGDGTLWAWGNNVAGQLGIGSGAGTRNAPTSVDTASNWTSITAGQGHSLALKADGTMWAWGDNTFGQLGNGTAVATNAPIQISAGTRWISVAAGARHSAAVAADGSLWEWGQIGANSSVPVRVVSGTLWKSVAAGGGHTVATAANGTLWGWGTNESGQIGDGTTTPAAAPVQIGTATSWVAAEAGLQHTAALQADGTLWNWGANTGGQLGTGGTTPATVPAQLLQPTIAYTPTVDFGNVRIGANAVGVITVTNSGKAPLAISIPAITGTDAKLFQVIVNSCIGASLQPAANCTMSVRFAPTLPQGNKTAAITIGSNDPDLPTATIPVTGTAIQGVTVAPAVLGSGTITPNKAQSVLPGTNVTFSFTPAAGHAVQALLVDGIPVPAAKSYTFIKVDQDHTLAVVFAPAMTITATAGAGGTINPAGAVSVVSGGNQTFTIIPAKGFTIGAFTVQENGGTTTLKGASSYTFHDLKGAASISATFVPLTYGGWTWRNPLPQGHTLRRIAYDGAGNAVAVGDGGTIITSPDGATWTVRQTGSSSLQGIAYGNGKFVAVGAEGRILVSADKGATWSTVPSGIATTLNGVTFGNGVFVAVGNSAIDERTYGQDMVALSSLDGLTWTKRLTPLPQNTFQDLLDVSFGNGRFVAVGTGGGVTVSTDGGATWTAPRYPGWYDLAGVSFGGGGAPVFGAVGGAGAVLVSMDGTTWDDYSLFDFVNFQGISFGTMVDPIFPGSTVNIFAAGADDGSVYLSEDLGKSWARKITGTGGAGIDPPLRGTLVGSTGIIAVGDDGAMVGTPDGETWTSLKTSLANRTFRGVASGNGSVVAVGEGDETSALNPPTGSPALLSSVNGGTTWQAATAPAAHNLHAVAFGAGQFAAVGASGYFLDYDATRTSSILTSADGLTWAIAPTTSYLDLNAIAFTGTNFVAVGDYDATFNPLTEGAAIVVSPSWTAAKLVTTTAGSLRAIASGNGVTVAVGDFGTVLTSADGGATWIERTFDPFIGDFNGIAWGNGIFVATTRGCEVYTSRDGVAWNRVTLPIPENSGFMMNTLIFQYGTFLAIGDSGYMISSVDGVSWTIELGGDYNKVSLRAIGGVGGTLVAVGTKGTILQSAAAPLKVALQASAPSPKPVGTQVVFTAAARGGGAASYEYQFWLKTEGVWKTVQQFSPTPTLNWTTTGAAPGTYVIHVDARATGSTAPRGEAVASMAYTLSDPAVPTSVQLVASPDIPQEAGKPVSVTFTATALGAPGPFEYQFWFKSGNTWTPIQPFSATSPNFWTWNATTAAPGTYRIQVEARRAGSTAPRGEVFASIPYVINAAPKTVALSSAPGTPFVVGIPAVTFTAAASGGTGPYEYQFWVKNGSWRLVQEFSAVANFTWHTAELPAGSYLIQAEARRTGSTAARGEAFTTATYTIFAVPPVDSVALTALPPNPATPKIVPFKAFATGGTGTYEYQFWLKSAGTWKKQEFPIQADTWNWDTTSFAPGSYLVQVEARSSGSVAARGDAFAVIPYVVP